MMMSDDDRDIDIESDEDNDSDTNSRSGPKLYNTQGFTQAQKRAHHNALERKRRDHIKDSFTSLREAVPSLKGEKASRAQILRKTAECIQMLMCKIQSHKKDVEDMKRQNALLEAQIRLLEKTRDEFALNIGDLHLKNGEGSDSSDMDDQELGRQSKKLKTCLELQ